MTLFLKYIEHFFSYWYTKKSNLNLEIAYENIDSFNILFVDPSI